MGATCRHPTILTAYPVPEALLARSALSSAVASSGRHRFGSRARLTLDAWSVWTVAVQRHPKRRCAHALQGGCAAGNEPIRGGMCYVQRMETDVSRFPCPYLEGEVELTEERETHIRVRHPDLLPEYRALIAETLAQPDEVRRSRIDAHARLFCRWYNEVRGGKHVVVVVVSDYGARERHWIITAYIIGQPASGDLEWKLP